MFEKCRRQCSFRDYNLVISENTTGCNQINRSITRSQGMCNRCLVFHALMFRFEINKYIFTRCHL